MLLTSMPMEQTAFSDANKLLEAFVVSPPQAASS
jgi:hypothetical protein